MSKNSQRDELILKHLHLVGKVVSKLTKKLNIFDSEDITSVGYLGLVDAANKYDSTRNVMFKTFAEHRIRGSILDYVRHADILTKKQRSMEKKLLVVIEKLEHELGRSAYDYEVADKLGVSIEEYWKMLECSYRASSVYLDDDDTQTDMYIPSTSFVDTPDNLLVTEQLIQRISKIVYTLTAREQLIFALYYYEAVTLQDMGDLLGVTDSRISQLIHKATDQIKEELNNG